MAMKLLLVLLVLVCVQIFYVPTNAQLTTWNACKNLGDYPISFMSSNCWNNPNIGASIVTIVTAAGYPIESHHVETKDGYVLTLFRIPNRNAQPVYLQSGIFTNSHVWVDKRNDSLAFQLYNKGFDVWLGNLRGTTYSREHVKLTSDDSDFWDFNLDTLSGIDIPASLELIRDTTHDSDIIYIGHSMGTTVGLLFAASKPKQADRFLKGIIALAPVAYLHHSTALSIFGTFSSLIQAALKLLGTKRFIQDDSYLRERLRAISQYIPGISSAIMQMIMGDDAEEDSPKNLLLTFSAIPESESVDLVLHFLQILNTKTVRMFDFGVIENLQKYGQIRPPFYDFGKVELPVFLLYGVNDNLCHVKDVTRLFNELGSTVKEMIEISKDPFVPFNHMNFLYSKNLSLLYSQIFDIINKLEFSKTKNVSALPDLLNWV